MGGRGGGALKEAVIDFNKDKMKRFSRSLNTRGMCVFLCGSSYEAGVLAPGFNSEVPLVKKQNEPTCMPYDGL